MTDTTDDYYARGFPPQIFVEAWGGRWSRHADGTREMEYVRAGRIEELKAERNALAEENERLRKRVKDMSSDIRIGYIHCEALAEIKATVDGKSDQPVADIISGCIAEVAAYRVTLAKLIGDTP
jgi:hypothetical protein